MVYYIANNNGIVIARTTATKLEPKEYDIDKIKARMADLDETIKSTIGDDRNAANETKIM